MLPTVLLALALAAPPAVKVAPDDEAKRLAQLSIREYEALDYEHALADAVKAFELSGAPELLYDLAQCHRALGHWRQAEISYRNYLREKPNAPNRSAVLMLIADMRAKEVEAPATKPPAAPAVVLPLPAAPAPEPAPQPDWTAPAPEASTTAAASPPSRTHALSWTLFGASAVAAGFAIYGAVRVANYQSLLGQVSSVEDYSAYESALAQAQRGNANAGNWQIAAIVLGSLAAVGAGIGALTW